MVLLRLLVVVFFGLGATSRLLWMVAVIALALWLVGQPFWSRDGRSYN